MPLCCFVLCCAGVGCWCWLLRRAAPSACCAVGVLRCRRAGGAVAAAALCEAAGPGAADEHTGTPGKCVCARAHVCGGACSCSPNAIRCRGGACAALLCPGGLSRGCAPHRQHTVCPRGLAAHQRGATTQTTSLLPCKHAVGSLRRSRRRTTTESWRSNATYVAHLSPGRPRGSGTTPVVGSLLATHAAFVLRCVALRCVPLLKKLETNFRVAAMLPGTAGRREKGLLQAVDAAASRSQPWRCKGCRCASGQCLFGAAPFCCRHSNLCVWRAPRLPHAGPLSPPAYAQKGLPRPLNPRFDCADERRHREAKPRRAAVAPGCPLWRDFGMASLSLLVPAAKFALVSEAYSILGQVPQRSRYDRQLRTVRCCLCAHLCADLCSLCARIPAGLVNVHLAASRDDLRFEGLGLGVLVVVCCFAHLLHTALNRTSRGKRHQTFAQTCATLDERAHLTTARYAPTRPAARPFIRPRGAEARPSTWQLPTSARSVGRCALTARHGTFAATHPVCPCWHCAAFARSSTTSTSFTSSTTETLESGDSSANARRTPKSKCRCVAATARPSLRPLGGRRISAPRKMPGSRSRCAAAQVRRFFVSLLWRGTLFALP